MRPWASGPTRSSSRSAAACACATSPAPLRRSSTRPSRTSARRYDHEGTKKSPFVPSEVETPCPRVSTSLETNGGGGGQSNMSAMLLALLLQQAAAEAPPPPPDPDTVVVPDVDRESIAGRRRPGYNAELPDAVSQDNPGAVRAPPPEAFPTDTIPVPDRWRILTGLCPKGADQSLYTLFHAMREVCHPRSDPYHQNVLKGDIPLGEHRPGFLKG